MSEMERPRPNVSSQARRPEIIERDDDEYLEDRIRNLKEFFEERQEHNSVNEQEITDEVNPENDNSNDVCPDPGLNSSERQTEDRVSEISVNISQVIQNSTTLTQHENLVESNPIEDSPTVEETSQSNLIDSDQSTFLYPRLSLSMWSPATAPQRSLDVDHSGAVHDPYSIDNFNPSILQDQLRRTYLPFIDIADENFLSEHENFITKDPRIRSAITRTHESLAEDSDVEDEFYYLISSFYDIRTKIDLLNTEFDVLQRKLAYLIPHVWSFSCEKIEAGAYCGDNVYLKRSIIYEQANYDRNLAKEIEDTLRQLRTIVYQQYVALRYETLWFKMKIDNYVAPFLLMNRTNENLLHIIEILFNFQRYRTRDQYFYQCTRQLLKQTIDIVYKYGNFNETLFIINHVLRCPPGVHQWATNFVRFLRPVSFEQLCSPIYIRYVAHFLSALLFPIKNRDVFLQNWLGENGESVPSLGSLPAVKNQQQWMLIDADGHERAALLRWDTLNEDDLIALLNQFNLNYLMKVLFGLKEPSRSEDEHRIVSYESTLRIIAILDLFVEILCRGFDTYADSQYKTFHKHIGKMIRDCVHVCRYHVDEVLQSLDPDDRIRLRDHYFAYIYRSVENIIRLCRNVRWSLLSLFALFDLPASLQNRLLHLICSIDDQQTVTVDSCVVMDQMLNSSTPSEILSLLKVLHNLGQNGDETNEISTVIFYITCLHPVSREYSLRDGRSILAHFASVRVNLISYLLKLAANHIDSVGKVLLGLFRSLPLEIWMPTDNDLSIIENWLNDISSASIDFQLALHLIDLMNWTNLPNQKQLCIPYTIHCEMALLFLRLHLKYCDKLAASRENQLQSQNFTTRTQINLEQWIWTAVLRLQLNQTCLTVESFIGSMSQEHFAHLNAQAQQSTTDNISHEMVNEIQRAIDQYHNSIAYYIAFGVDQAGASAAGFFESGITYLSQLVQNGKYTAAIRVLHDMSGILERSADYLIEHATFMNTLKTLLNASDASSFLSRTPLSYVMSTRSTDETSNAKLMTAALIDLLVWLEDNSRFRRAILLFWFKLLTGMKDWNRDNSTLFILDNILTHSFVHDVMNEEVSKHLFDLAVSALNPQHNQQVTRTNFLSWLPLPSAVSSTQTYWSSLSIDSSLLSRYPMVSYHFLSAENSFEIDQNVLVELKTELELNPSGKLDQIWKKLIQQRHFPMIPLTSLSIYRWGTMASQMPAQHPLLPIVWEKFFTIYLSKHEHCLHSVGHRLFESQAQTTFLKQMKRSLSQASEVYASSTSLYGKELSKFYHSLSLWIDEPRLHDPQLNIAALPSQYKDPRLLELFERNYPVSTMKWLELVDLRQIYERLIKFSNDLWARKRDDLDQQGRSNLHRDRLTMTSSEKLIDLVSNVQCPPTSIRVHVHQSEPFICPNIIESNNHDLNQLKKIFSDELNKIIGWIRKHIQRHDKQYELDQRLMTLLSLQWKNEFQEQSIHASCQNHLNPVHQCTRPAYIVVRYKSKQQCQSTNQSLDLVLSEHKQLSNEACRSCDVEICASIDSLHQIVQYLTRELSSTFNNEKQSLAIIEIGTTLFYSLLSMYETKHNDFMQPIADQLNSLYDTLGEIFVKSNLRQPQAILEYVAHGKANVPHLIAFFDPNSLIQSEKFIEIYRNLSKLQTFVECVPYLLQMFRKFNVKKWFENNFKESERLRFIETLFDHFRAMVENFSSKSNDNNLIEKVNQLFDITIGHMIQILQYSYPSQIGCLFEHLVKLIETLRKKQTLIQQENDSLVPLEFQQSIERGLLPTKVLSEFLDELIHLDKKSKITLGAHEIHELITWLYQFVVQQADEHNDKRLVKLYRNWRPLSNELTRIYSIMIILSIEKVPKAHEGNVKIIFDQILLLYGAFIDPTNSLFSLAEWKIIIDHQGDLLTRLIKTFLQLNEEFLERIKDSDQQQREFYDCLFQYWYKIVKSLMDIEYAHPILDIYHRYLTHVPWNNYCLTIESILILDQLILANNHEKNSSFSLYEFILHLVSSIDIHQFMLNDDEHSLVSLVPIYFRLLVNIFISSQVKFTQNADALSRLSSHSESIPWKYLDSETYMDVVERTLSKLDKNFIMSARASIDGYLNRILRCASEFSQSSLLVERVRLKRISYLRLIELCLINGKNEIQSDEYRLTLVNILNEIETLTTQGSIQMGGELEDVFIELIRFLNISSFGQTILNQYQTYFLDWIRQSQRSISALPLFVSVCRTLKDRHRKILFIENLLLIYFLHDETPDWSIVFQLFQLNEDLSQIKVDDWIQLCCEYNAFFTLFLYSEFQLKLNRDLVRENILDNEYRYLEKFIDLLTNGQIRIIHGEEERVLLIMLRINEILIHQLEFGKNTDPLLIRLVRNYSNWLLNLGADSKEYAYTGLFAMIGLGKKAQYSLRFRLFVRLLGTMQLLHISDEPSIIRVNPNDRQPDPSSINNSILKQSLTALSVTTATANEYNEFKNQLIHCNSEYLQKPDATFFNISDLIQFLTVHLFSDLSYLNSSPRND